MWKIAPRRLITNPNNKATEKEHPSGIKIPSFGNFDLQALDVLKKFCLAATSKKEISSEERWIFKSQTRKEKKEIKRALWHTVTNKPILKFQRKAIDPISYSDLVEERYLDNFVIDIFIGKYEEQARQHGNYTTLYLPSEFFFWMSWNKREFQCEKLAHLLESTKPEKITQILAPIHFLRRVTGESFTSTVKTR